MHEIDASFKEQKERMARLRAAQQRRRIAVAGGVFVLVAAIGTIGFFGMPHLGRRGAAPVEQAGTEPPKPDAAAPVPAATPALLDLAGDPMSISIGDSVGAQKVRAVPKPDDLGDPRVPEQIRFLSDTMIAGSERFMTTLPSTPEDFAFFQSQSARTNLPGSADDAAAAAAKSDAANQAPADGLTEVEETAPEPDQGEAADEVLVPVESQDDFVPPPPAPAAAPTDIPPDVPADADDFDGASAGGPADQGDSAQPPASQPDTAPSAPSAPSAPAADAAPADPAAPNGPAAPVSPAGQAAAAAGSGGNAPALPQFRKPRIENNISVIEVTREADRFRRDDDVLVRIPTAQPVPRLITDNGFSADDAGKAADALKAATGIEALEPGFVVAMRGDHEGGRGSPAKLVQLSVYRSETFLGTVALSDSGDYVQGADPWLKDELFFYSKEESETPKRDYRLLDAIYSTATRNGVPTGVIGEAIMLMSRTFDLQAMATTDQKLVLVYSETPRDSEKGAGRVLYAAVRGPDKSLECVVYQAKAAGPFSCLSEKDQSQTLTVTNGMVTPTNGVMSSTFGPRKHPILEKVRDHKGVDWAAPIGTPVVAAFDGTVAFAGDGKGYGNFIRIDHGGGKGTGYAHLQRFQDGIQVGVKVSAGETIGFVGTTGLSTGPHLHFELYQNGVAIDPMGGGSMASAGGPAVSSSDAGAVEKLVNVIITVESGGNARAKNPLSSASGLGQFIESTWIRMMQTYRPALVASKSRAELLELRFDPGLAREMVGNLAREGEAYLKARGHQITAGRLYLAHFLGPGGADQVLSADPSASLQAVLGDGVIRANPFLTGKTAAFVEDWAERKMNHKPGRIDGGSSTRTVVRASPEFLKYRDALAKLVQTVSASL